MKRRSRRRFLHGSLAVAGLGLLAGCGGLPLGGRRSARLPRVGIIIPGSSDNAVATTPTLEGFRALGYVDGQNIQFVWKYADGDLDRLPSLAGELVLLGIDVIVAVSTPAASAAKRATATIPIVFAATPDAVSSGLVESLARPGGNLTGTTDTGPESGGKRLELLHEAIPGVGRIAVLRSTVEPRGYELEAIEAVGRRLGVPLAVVEVSVAADLESAFHATVAEAAKAILVARSNLTTTHQSTIAALALRHRLPSLFNFRDFVAAGGLLAYGPNNQAQHRRTATFVDKILKGARPADLPVEQPTLFDVVVNLKTAEALGLTIPPSVLIQATEVIQ